MKLNEIGNGGLQEVYDLAEKKIIENAKDPNTEYKANRKITVELKFKMDENREVINLEYSVKPTLAPFRTFSEIEQPESSFVLRVNDRGRVGLFEADGGAWRNTAMLRIKEYLDNHLNEGKTREEKLFSIIA